MKGLTPLQIKYLTRCIDKNIEILDCEKDESIISELQKISGFLTDKTFTLEFETDEETFAEVDNCLAQQKFLHLFRTLK